MTENQTRQRAEQPDRPLTPLGWTLQLAHAAIESERERAEEADAENRATTTALFHVAHQADAAEALAYRRWLAWQSARARAAERSRRIDLAHGAITRIQSVHRRHVCDGVPPEDCGCAEARAEALAEEPASNGEICGHCTRPYPCPTRCMADAAIDGMGGDS